MDFLDFLWLQWTSFPAFVATLFLDSMPAFISPLSHPVGFVLQGFEIIPGWENLTTRQETLASTALILLAVSVLGLLMVVFGKYFDEQAAEHKALVEMHNRMKISMNNAAKKACVPVGESRRSKND